MQPKTTLVLGGTGKTGRRVADRLKARGVPVRIGSRSGEPPFDWADPATWTAALRDAGSVYVSYYPDLAARGSIDAIRAFTEAAVASGAPRLVLLSGRGEADARRCEQIVQGCGTEWTVLRASWFSQNFSEGYFLDPIVAGELALPVGNVGEPFVDADDIADIAVAALTGDAHVGQVYELTGPRLWTFAEATAEIARVTGREIRYVELPIDDYAAALEQAQLPPDVVALIRYLFTDVLDGRNSSITDGVTRALGRPARDFTDYVQDTAATGVWKGAR